MLKQDQLVADLSQEGRSATCIHRLFEEQVARTPDAIAVVFESDYWTYRELNRRSNQLASYLRKLNVGPEKIVGLRIERSLEMILAMVGILKAGGTYVPLDPELPKERLKFMLEDSGAVLLLTRKSMASEIPLTAIPVVNIDVEMGSIINESEEPFESNVSGNDLAYVIYTSGSTGTPKGVMIQHNSLVSFSETAIAVYSMKPADRVLQFASISWDTSCEEIWPTLLCGATLVLRTNSMLDSTAAFVQKCKDWSLTVINLPTAYWHELTGYDAEALSLLKSLRLVIIGGEKARKDKLLSWQRSAGQHIRLVNTYGATEATAVTTLFDLSEGVTDTGEEVPIGNAFPNARVYVLDSDLRPVSAGHTGELHIGGKGLARGYLGQPALTAARFIPDPFSPDPGARLYRTGDQARILPDGNLVLVGRMDHQIKYRGFRIELGEIESALRQRKDLKEAVVVLREDEPGEKRLVAYVVPALANQDSVSVTDLRRFLKERLPVYMLPTNFVIIEKLPLTTSGKVDRRALPVPELSRPELEEVYVAPRDVLDEVLVGIWGDVLGIRQVGIYDNFFELGGHSLLATQLVSRLRIEFQSNLSIQDLFHFPTVSGFASLMTRDPAEEARIRKTALVILELSRLSDDEVKQGLEIHAMPDSKAGKPGIGSFELTPAKQSLLNLLVGENSAEGQRIVRRAKSESTPLSFALWFADQLQPGNTAYNITEGIRLRGRLNVDAMERSVNEIIRRHEALRTNFASKEDRPVLVVVPELTVNLPVVDLTVYSEEQREEEAQRQATVEAQHSFDLARGSLLRVKLLRFSEEDHLFLLTIHHVVSDGWSLVLFFRELAILYDAFSRGNPSPLAELPVQYGDYAEWFHEWFQGEVQEKQISYWKKQLGGEPIILELPTDHPRAVLASNRGATKYFTLPSSLSDSLRNLGVKEGTTLFMTLLAAFQVLLFRYTRQTDIRIGTPIAGRNRVEIEDVIGFFINTIVIRSNLSGNPTFRDLLQRVREVSLDAYANQDLPFEKLVEELRPERTPGNSVLYQVMFVLQNAPGQVQRMTGLTVSPFEVESGTSMFDLCLDMVDNESGLKGGFEYSTDLFKPETIDRLTGHFLTLLEAIVTNPNQSILDLPLLTETEREDLSKFWVSSRIPLPLENSVHQLFEKQVKETPDAIAVTYGEDQLTYLELNRRANQLTHYLSNAGIGPESIVAIYMERSMQILVGLLGILKSGAAFLPLDPKMPKEQIQHLMTDSSPSMVLTHDSLSERFADFKGRIVCLNSDWQAIAREGEKNPEISFHPENLAYVIYTSGTTGKPKGIQVTHRSLLNHSLAMKKEYGIRTNDRVLQFASLGFDVALEEIFPSLISGAAVILRPDSVLVSLDEFSQFVSHHKITVLNLPASFWHEWVAEISDTQQIAASLRLMVVGSESVLPPRFAKWQKMAGDRIELRNAYGLAEATITTTVYNPGSAQPENKAVPIGTPISNTEVYILDQNLMPVPIGIPGELCIGGEGLARGYLNHSDLTAEKFVPNQFSGKEGARLYRTGDLARILSDGNVELIGRIDDQLKIRGFRIEPVEVELALGQHPAIQEAVVLAREESPGDRKLVAYLVQRTGQTVSTNDLRNFLKKKIAEYMIPSAFLLLQSIPHLSNGKVDRLALPARSIQVPDLQKAYQPPRDSLEFQLSKIWEKILNLDTISMNDNFFDLGGHSLTAVRLFAHIQKAFGRNIPLATLFEASTIEQLAAILRKDGWSPNWSSLVPIQPAGSRPPFFCVHEVGGNVLNYRALASRLGPDQPFYGLQSQGLDGKQSRLTSVEQMAAHYIEEIQHLQPEGPYYLGGSSFGGVVAFEMAQQLRRKGEKVGMIAMFDTHGPGYPTYRPNISSWRKKMYRYIRSTQHYVGSLLLMEPETKTVIFRSIADVLKRQLSRFYMGKSNPLPPVLSEIQIINRQAGDAYIPDTYAGPVVLFRGSKQPLGIYPDPSLGWRDLAGGGLEIHEVPGGHALILLEPRVKFLAEQLNQVLKEKINQQYDQ